MSEKTSIHYTKEHFVEQLAGASAAYLRTGLLLFHGSGGVDRGSRQAAVGNIGIAIELMCKCYLADKSLSLVLKGDSYLNRAYDLVEPQVRAKGNFRKLTQQLISGRADMRDLNEILNAVYDFLPGAKVELSYVLKDRLSVYRNAAVHAAYHASNIHQVELSVWAALRIHELLQDAGFSRVSSLYEMTSADMSFVTAFETGRAEALEAKVATARQAAENISEIVPANIEDVRTQFAAQCPVCGHEALLSGNVRFQQRLVFTADDDVEEEISFTFMAERLSCPTCHLDLSDPWEMGKQAVPLHYDVAAVLEQWADQNKLDLYSEFGAYDEPEYGNWEPDDAYWEAQANWEPDDAYWEAQANQEPDDEYWEAQANQEPDDEYWEAQADCDAAFDPDLKSDHEPNPTAEEEAESELGSTSQGAA